MSSVDLFNTEYTTFEIIDEISVKLNEPSWLTERRKKSFKEFLELPYDQDSLFYKYTNFRKFNPGNLHSVLSFDTPEEIDTTEIQIHNTKLSVIETEFNLISNLDKELIQMGIYFGSLHNLIIKNEKLAKKIVDQADKYSENFDKLGSLARAFATNITILYIPKNIIVEEILAKLTTLGGNEVALFSEFIGFFEENSQVRFIEILESRSKETHVPNMYNSTQTLILKDNSRVISSQIQNWDEKTMHILARKVNIGRYGNLKTLSQLQGGDMSRLNSNLDLAGQGSEGYDLFVKFGGERQRFDIKSELHHIGRDTIGNVHARTVMMNRAESILRGMIVIPISGVNTDSYLTSQGMTIGKGKITAIPALNIDQNDVQAAHAASVEPLNEELIFYLASRGISEDLSREMLIKGYFDYIHKQMNDLEINTLSMDYLSEKWEERRGN